MGPLKMLHFLTSTLIFKVNRFLVMHLFYKNALAADVPRQIWLDSHGPCCGVVPCSSFSLWSSLSWSNVWILIDLQILLFMLLRLADLQLTLVRCSKARCNIKIDKIGRQSLISNSALRGRLKTRFAISILFYGGVFHSRIPATDKALFPKTVFVLVMSNWPPVAARSLFAQILLTEDEYYGCIASTDQWQRHASSDHYLKCIRYLIGSQWRSNICPVMRTTTATKREKLYDSSIVIFTVELGTI